MSPYWQQQVSPWSQAGERLSERIIQLPAIRAQAQQRAAMNGYYSARAGQANASADEALARARLLSAQSSDEEAGNASQDRMAAALKKVATNPNDTEAAGDAISEFGHYFKKNPDAAAKGVGDLFSRVMAMRGDTNWAQQGALQGGAASIANNQANIAAKATVGAKPAAAGVVNTAAQKVPGEIAQDISSSQQIPVDAATKKPYPLLMPQGFGTRAQQLFSDLNGVGIPLSEITPDVESLLVGTNASVSPNVVTNRPGIPAVSHLIGADEPAVPPRLGTNSFTLRPGGADQAVIQELSQNPKVGAVLSKYGLIGATNTPPTADAGTGPAPTNAPASAGAAPAPNGSNLPAVPGTFGTNAAPMKYSTPDDVKADYRTGKLDRATASQILQSQFGMQ